jgi:hypothetical protein
MVTQGGTNDTSSTSVPEEGEVGEEPVDADRGLGVQDTDAPARDEAVRHEGWLHSDATEIGGLLPIQMEDIAHAPIHDETTSRLQDNGDSPPHPVLNRGTSSSSAASRSRGSDAPGSFYAALMEEKEAFRAVTGQTIPLPLRLANIDSAMLALATTDCDPQKKPDPDGEMSHLPEPALRRARHIVLPGAYSIEGSYPRFGERWYRR